jgi:tRNA (cmo5U34)-methyltransferase
MPARHFDEDRAAAYDRRIREAIPGYEALHQLTCMVVAEATGGRGRVLVAGAGTGAECVALAQSCPNLHVVGVDPSEAMLEHATAKVAEHGLAARIRLYADQVSGLPAFEKFDAATLLLVLHFLADDGAKAALLRDIAERLNPGAPLVLADLFLSPDEQWQSELMTLWRHLQLSMDIPEEQVDRGFKHVQRDFHPLGEDRLEKLLTEAGFTPPRPYFRALCFGGWVSRKV